MTIKGKRATITPESRAYIFYRATKSPNIPRTELAKDLRVELVQRNWDVPQVEVLERMISQARNHPVSDLDSQWSVGCMPKYDISSEALLKVLTIYERRLGTEEYSFTIREALWVARLYKAIDDPIVLEWFASVYALRDKIAWILDNPVDTRDLDFKLLNYCNEDRRAEFIAMVHQFPAFLDPFPVRDLQEVFQRGELIEKLEQKGYHIEIETPEMKSLKLHVEQLWLEELRKRLGELKKRLGQKGYVMTYHEELLIKRIERRWPSLLDELGLGKGINREKEKKDERSHTSEG